MKRGLLPLCIKLPLLASFGVVLLAALPWRAAAHEDDVSPRPLTTLVRQSAVVVLAQCISNSAGLDGLHLLTLKPVEVLKSARPLTNFQLSIFARHEFYPRLLHSRPALLFLTEESPGQFDLLYVLDQDAGAIDLQPVTRAASRLVTLGRAKTDVQARELKGFALENLAAPDGSILKQTAAVELLNWAKVHPGTTNVSEAELDLISKTALNAHDPKIACPLSLALLALNAPSADEACLHAILDTDAASASEHELASVVNRRPLLRQKLSEQARRETDPTKLDRLIEHLSRVLDAGTRRDLREIWDANPGARKTILSYTNRLSAEDWRTFEAQR